MRHDGCCYVAMRPPVSGILTFSALKAPLLTALFLLLVVAFPALSFAQTGGLQLSDVYYRIDAPTPYAPVRTLKFSWTPEQGVTLTGLARSQDGFISQDPLDPSGSGGTSYFYDHSWTSGASYEYYLVGTREAYNPVTMTTSTVAWESNHVPVTPCDLPAQGNGAVDSRVDPRYGNIHYKDYPFNIETKPATGKPGVFHYRGGLYAGHNSDSGVIGRSYLRFNFVAAPVSGTVAQKLYPYGGLYAFSTRLVKTGSVPIACQRAASVTWPQEPLVWTNVPATVGTTVSDYTTIDWDSTNPTSAWQTINALKLVEDQQTDGGQSVLNLFLRGRDEVSGNGWAYFAMKEFVFESHTGYGPRLIYAWGGPGLN